MELNKIYIDPADFPRPSHFRQSKVRLKPGQTIQYTNGVATVVDGQLGDIVRIPARDVTDCGCCGRPCIPCCCCGRNDSCCWLAIKISIWALIFITLLFSAFCFYYFGMICSESNEKTYSIIFNDDELSEASYISILLDSLSGWDVEIVVDNSLTFSTLEISSYQTQDIEVEMYLTVANNTASYVGSISSIAQTKLDSYLSGMCWRSDKVLLTLTNQQPVKTALIDIKSGAMSISDIPEGVLGRFSFGSATTTGAVTMSSVALCELEIMEGTMSEVTMSDLTLTCPSNVTTTTVPTITIAAEGNIEFSSTEASDPAIYSFNTDGQLDVSIPCSTAYLDAEFTIYAPQSMVTCDDSCGCIFESAKICLGQAGCSSDYTFRLSGAGDSAINIVNAV
ncbi:hypothetical protein ADUPG1_008811 [Aduncisulcus paluster]|uniref:Uncharacterized protein n=1 Tax=Aduncisulcus paluster TaxID=2918883 RepID=A0ABQ5KTC0_9EUKA|nr:hypothetical protein ADUPG1_008811 [Aduncisulcus paluster]